MVEHKDHHPRRLRRPTRTAPLPRRHTALLQGGANRKSRMNQGSPAHVRGGPRPAPLDRSFASRPNSDQPAAPVEATTPDPDDIPF
jgi:hypothetical protein